MNVLQLLNHQPFPGASIQALLNHDQPPPQPQPTLGKRLPPSPATPVKRPRLRDQLPEEPLAPPLLSTPSHGVTLSVCSSLDIGNTDDLSSSCSTIPNDLDWITTSVGRSPQQPARRLAQSRIVGHRYRANERRRSLNLADDVERLKEENDMLLEEIAASQQRRAYFENELSGEEAPLTHGLSGLSSYIVGVNRITGASALILLSMIAGRRNLFSSPSSQPQLVLECPTYETTDSVIRNGFEMARLEGRRAERYGVKAMLWEAHVWTSVGRLHASWATFEMGTVTLEERPHFEKRCTRCGKVRTAGSGHPRSECDDGRKVGSLIPYQGADTKPTGSLFVTGTTSKM